MDRAAALAALGLAAGASHDDIKRRFRHLAHDLHPDYGGDPERFQTVHAATRALLDAPERAPAPRVARGRPSRDTADAEGADVRSPQRPDLRDEDLVPLCDHERRDLALRPRTGAVDVLLLARLLLDATSLQLISRAPGSRTNRFAPMLAEESASILHIRRGVTPAAAPVGALAPRATHSEETRVALLARGRAARRAVATAAIEGLRAASWRRERGDTTLLIAGTVRSEADLLRNARLVTTAAIELLEVLLWPLGQWTLSAPPSRRPTVEPPSF